MIFLTMKNEPMIKMIYQYGPSARTWWRIAPLPVAAQYGIYLITISLLYCDFGMINNKIIAIFFMTDFNRSHLDLILNMFE